MQGQPPQQVAHLLRGEHVRLAQFRCRHLLLVPQVGIWEAKDFLKLCFPTAMVLIEIVLSPKFVGVEDLKFWPPKVGSQIHRYAKEQG